MSSPRKLHLWRPRGGDHVVIRWGHHRGEHGIVRQKRSRWKGIQVEVPTGWVQVPAIFLGPDTSDPSTESSEVDLREQPAPPAVKTDTPTTPEVRT